MQNLFTEQRLLHFQAPSSLENPSPDSPETVVSTPPPSPEAKEKGYWDNFWERRIGKEGDHALKRSLIASANLALLYPVVALESAYIVYKAGVPTLKFSVDQSWQRIAGVTRNAVAGVLDGAGAALTGLVARPINAAVNTAGGVAGIAAGTAAKIASLGFMAPRALTHPLKFIPGVGWLNEKLAGQQENFSGMGGKALGFGWDGVTGVGYNSLGALHDAKQFAGNLIATPTQMAVSAVVGNNGEAVNHTIEQTQQSFQNSSIFSLFKYGSDDLKKSGIYAYGKSVN